MNIMGLGQNLKKIPVKYHGLRIGTASTNPSYFGVNSRVPGWPDPIMSFFLFGYIPLYDIPFYLHIVTFIATTPGNTHWIHVCIYIL